MNTEVDIHEARRLRKILQQLQNLGWSKVENVDQDFQKVILIHRDENTEKVHELSMILPDNYPSQPPNQMCCKDLPPSLLGHILTPNTDEETNTESKVFTLVDIYSNFVDNIEKYRPLRKMLRDLDENTWVLDPPDESSRNSLEYTYRRVALLKGVSLQIDFNPENSVNQLPALKFLGSDEKTCPLREVLSSNMEDYDPDYTLVQNLERILELEFPQRECLEEQEDLNLECAICYSYRLGDQFPTESCDDPAGCGKSFHEACLFEWLRSLPEQCSKMSFRSIFGQCPYCEKPISCRMII